MARLLWFQPDPMLVRTLARALRPRGVEVLTSETPGEAQAWLAGGTITMVVVSSSGPGPSALLTEAARLCPSARRVRLAGDDETRDATDGQAEWLSFTQLRQAFDEAPEPAVPHLDREQILDCVQGDTEALDDVKDLFVSGAQKQLARLETALGEGDEDTARQALHRLQGAAATAGSAHLASLCHHDRTTSLPPSLPAQLRAALGQFEDAYARWRRSPS